MEFIYDGVKVYYEQYGEAGDHLLLLHGWGGKCESWLPVIRDFQGAMRLTVVDFPGHGRSGEPNEPWSVTEYMEMTAALLRHLGIERTHIMAHSFGGRVSILLASTHPEMVGKMVLTGAAGIRPMPTAKKSMKSRVYGALKKTADNAVTRKLFGDTVDEWRHELGTMFGSEDYKKLSPGMRATFNRVILQDLEPCLPDVKASTLLFWGKEDTATPLWMGELMAQKIPDAGLVAYDGVGHFAYLDKYAEFHAVSRSFLLG